MLTGPPGKVSNITFEPDERENCTLVVQWNEVSHDPTCGPVTYAVRVFTFANRVIFNHTTSDTYCTIPDFSSSNTDYTIGVTASNNVGESSEVVNMMTSNGKFIFCTQV